MENTPTQFWLFQVPNLILAAAMYTLIGRYVLSLFFRRDSDLVIWRVWRQLTDPMLNATRAITPAVVPAGLVMVLAIFWTVLLRALLTVAAITLDFAPKAAG